MLYDGSVDCCPYVVIGNSYLAFDSPYLLVKYESGERVAEKGGGYYYPGNICSMA